MSNALLPEHREEWTVNQLTEGASGYTVPWAMWADRKRNLWLHPGYSLFKQSGGTAQMVVSKTESGYVVGATSCGYFSWGTRDNPGYVGVEQDWIPVSHVKW